MIIINVTKNEATVVQTEKLTSGTIGLECKFNFSEEWENLEKIAVCSCGNVTKDVFDVSDTIVVPWEVMAVHGKYLEIGVYGKSSDGGVIIPTVYATVGAVCKGADPSGDESVAPTPTLWDKLRDKTKELSDTIETANTATKEANEATRKANLATENTNAVIESANKVVSAAGEATRSAEKATADTLLAKDQVVEATEKANIATKRANDAARGINDNFANAIKGTATGEIVSMTDVSPLEHTMSVKATSDNIPLYPYTINQDHIGGVPYEIEADGTIHISGICDGSKNYGQYVIIKEIFLSAGKYTISAIFPEDNVEWNIGLILEGNEFPSNVINSSNEKSTFDVATDSVVQIAILPTTAPGREFDVELKPLLSKGTEIAPEVSSAKVYKQGENLINPEEFTKKSTNTTLVGDVFTTNFIDGRIFLNSGKISPFKAGTYTVTITPMKYSKPLYMGIYVYGVNDPNTVILQPKYIDAQVEPYKYTFTTRGDFIFALGGYKATSTTNYEGLGTVSYTVQLVEGKEPASVEEYSIAPDGTVEGVTSLYPRTALYTDTAGVTLEVEYNRDINTAFEELRAAVISLASDI